MQKAARDIVVGDVLLTSNGERYGQVTMRDGHTTPGVIYLYLDGHEDPPADVCMNHGDPVQVEGRPKLEDVIALARRIKDEYDHDMDGFRANPHGYMDHAGFLVPGYGGEMGTPTSKLYAAAVALVLEVE